MATVTAPTLIYSNSEVITSANTFTTPNFTTVSNTFLMCVFGIAAIVTSAYTNTIAAAMTCTSTSFNFTNLLGYSSSAAGNKTMISAFGGNVVTGSATSNVTFHWSSNVNSKAEIAIFSCNNVNWTTPKGATGANTGLTSNGAATVTLSGTPLVTSCVFGARVVQYGGNGGAANGAASWTSLKDMHNSAGEVGLQVQYYIGTTSTSVSWQQTILGDSVYNSSENIIGFEILAVAAARRKFIVIS